MIDLLAITGADRWLQNTENTSNGVTKNLRSRQDLYSLPRSTIWASHLPSPRSQDVQLLLLLLFCHRLMDGAKQQARCLKQAVFDHDARDYLLNTAKFWLPFIVSHNTLFDATNRGSPSRYREPGRPLHQIHPPYPNLPISSRTRGLSHHRRHLIEAASVGPYYTGKSCQKPRGMMRCDYMDVCALNRSISLASKQGPPAVTG